MYKQSIAISGRKLPGIKTKLSLMIKLTSMLCLISIVKVSGFTPAKYNTIFNSNKISAPVTITGTVKDENGLPIPGVSVKVSGANIATQTGVNGS